METCCEEAGDRDIHVGVFGEEEKEKTSYQQQPLELAQYHLVEKLL